MKTFRIVISGLYPWLEEVARRLRITIGSKVNRNDCFKKTIILAADKSPEQLLWMKINEFFTPSKFKCSQLARAIDVNKLQQQTNYYQCIFERCLMLPVDRYDRKIAMNFQINLQASKRATDKLHSFTLHMMMNHFPNIALSASTGVRSTRSLLPVGGGVHILLTK